MAIGPAVSVFAKDGVHRMFRNLRNQKWGALGVIHAFVLLKRGMSATYFRVISIIVRAKRRSDATRLTVFLRVEISRFRDCVA